MNLDDNAPSETEPQALVGRIEPTLSPPTTPYSDALFAGVALERLAEIGLGGIDLANSATARGGLASTTHSGCDAPTKDAPCACDETRTTPSRNEDGASAQSSIDFASIRRQMLSSVPMHEATRASAIFRAFERAMANTGSIRNEPQARAFAQRFINDILTAQHPTKPGKLLTPDESSALQQALGDAGLAPAEIHDPPAPQTDEELLNERAADYGSQGLRGMYSDEQYLTVKNHFARCLSMPMAVEEDLLYFAASAKPDNVLVSYADAWRADNLELAGRFEEARQVWSQTRAQYPGARYGALPLAPIAVAHQVYCLRKTNRLDAALGVLRSFYDETDSPTWRCRTATYIGLLAETTGDVLLADAAYTAALDTERDADARAGLARLGSDRETVYPTLAALHQRLAEIIERKDVPRLRALARAYDFQFGIGCGETTSVPREQLLHLLSGDLQRGAVRASAELIHADDDKYYLRTTSWSGDYFVGEVLFQLRAVPRGWQWSGIVLSLPTKSWSFVLGQLGVPSSSSHNQPLPSWFTIRAPWARPSQTNIGVMRAGGLWSQIAQLVILLNTRILAAALPVFWPIYLAMAAAFHRSACGFALAGFYYNDGPTHRVGALSSAFAIDFSVLHPSDRLAQVVQEAIFPLSVIPANRFNEPALACAAGTVFVSDDPLILGMMSNPNYGNAATIELAHPVSGFAGPAAGTPTTTGGANWLGARSVVPAQNMARGPFASRYMHFRFGTLRAVPMPTTLTIPQGSILGTYNNTGNSAFDHIHFEMHDATLPAGTGDPLGGTVRPTPMDGVTLLDNENGKCITSTNIPLP